MFVFLVGQECPRGQARSTCTSQVHTVVAMDPEWLPHGPRMTHAGEGGGRNSGHDTEVSQKFLEYFFFPCWFLRHFQRKSRKKTAQSGAEDKRCLEGINEVSRSDWLMMGFHRGGGGAGVAIVCREDGDT